MYPERLLPSAVAVILAALLLSPTEVISEEEEAAPLESQCRPYIEKALKGLGTGEIPEEAEVSKVEEGEETSIIRDQSTQQIAESSEEMEHKTSIAASDETQEESEELPGGENQLSEEESSKEIESEEETHSGETEKKDSSEVQDNESKYSNEKAEMSIEESIETPSHEPENATLEADMNDELVESNNVDHDDVLQFTQSESPITAQDIQDDSSSQEALDLNMELRPDKDSNEETILDDTTNRILTSEEMHLDKEDRTSAEDVEASELASISNEPITTEGHSDSTEEHSGEETLSNESFISKFDASKEETQNLVESSKEEPPVEESFSSENASTLEEHEESSETTELKEPSLKEDSLESIEEISSKMDNSMSSEASPISEEVLPPEEEDLSMNIEIPDKLRSRDHISEILRLSKDSAETELLLSKTIDVTLRDLKRLYETAIKPLEILYKYRDLSNRHFGDPEIFSKPLILFMGPWSGGKSTIINYLLDNEYKKSALRTGAEPSPAYFNIVMWGEREEVLDGTQLAADWTFSGLQKFGQGLLDRLRGLTLNHPLLEKVNIVEIPGILEIRKQVERLFPFNDACQWFIDRADIIFLVYDPSKLDVGPESEAILDQLKGREYQTRIILNKADQVKPEELMRVQGTLIWNISPLMSSTEPPIMYSTSLWSLPYESGSPTRLLFAQEKAFLKDFKDAIDKRVENKISSARRFAVRVRNHAKMVDCYLTTYYNHKTFFGNKKIVSDDIIEHPQNYHIYEGLSTLTNISRYDLPDPEVYKDFFRLNPVYDFQQLSATCTYFRGCPINRLDVAIAYELPELVGKYKKSAEEVLKNIKKSEINS